MSDTTQQGGNQKQMISEYVDSEETESDEFENYDHEDLLDSSDEEKTDTGGVCDHAKLQVVGTLVNPGKFLAYVGFQGNRRVILNETENQIDALHNSWKDWAAVSQEVGHLRVNPQNVKWGKKCIIFEYLSSLFQVDGDGKLDLSNRMYFAKRKISLDQTVLVVGDIHGSLASLWGLLEHFREKQYINQHFELAENIVLVFTGDYCDYSLMSLEILALLRILQLHNSEESIVLLQGNHETEKDNKTMSGNFVEEEIWRKYDHGTEEANLQENNSLFKNLRSWMLNLTTVLFLEFANHTIVQLNHGAIDFEYIPDVQAFLKKTYDAPTGSLKRQNIAYKHGNASTGFHWGDFSSESNPKQISPSRPLFGRNALETYLQKTGISKIVGGHQDFVTLAFATNKPTEDADTRATYKDFKFYPEYESLYIVDVKLPERQRHFTGAPTEFAIPDEATALITSAATMTRHTLVIASAFYTLQTKCCHEECSQQNEDDVQRTKLMRPMSTERPTLQKSTSSAASVDTQRNEKVEPLYGKSLCQSITKKGQKCEYQALYKVPLDSGRTEAYVCGIHSQGPLKNLRTELQKKK